MPLLNRKAFRTDPPPSNLKENEELFVCRQTNEVYRDYESFFKRTILCNSLVWSCEVTLKHGLTYEEAAESEKEAKKIVERVPQPIQRGVLTLVHYTRHSRLDNLCDEVFNYIRERYQEGEEIDVKYNGEKLVGWIHNVIEPTVLTNGFDSPKSKKKENSPTGKSPSKSPTKAQSPGKTINVIILSDDESKSEQTEVNSQSTLKKTSSWPDAKSYQYMVKLKCTRNTPSKMPECITVKQPSISRKKGVFSREKLKLLLRLTCSRIPQGSDTGYWKVKDEYRKRFDLSPDMDDENVNIEKTTKKRKREQECNEGKNVKRIKKNVMKDKRKLSAIAQTKKDKVDDKAKVVKPKMTQEEIEKLKEDLKIRREKEKEIRRLEREKARQEKSELLKEQRMFLLHWCVPQDDLDLDDHQELPKPIPVESKFPAAMFGDIIMVLEFLYIFGEFFAAKQDFPDGITLDILEEALTEHDAEGSFYDIIRFLLSSILKTHAEEEEEEGLDDSDVHAHEDHVKSTRQEEEDEDSRVKKAVSVSATMAAAWAQVHQGRNLHELTLDPFTCSEILRLHFLSSGASLGADGDPYRWQSRGGFTISDDAGVAFRHDEHTIMRELVTGNIYDLNSVEKLKILKTLCAQLLTYATSRDIIDDGFDRLRKAKREWQEEQWADQRKDKEEAAAKYRKRMEEKAKEKERNENTEDGKADVVQEESKQEPTACTSSENGNEDERAFTRSQGAVAEEQSIDVEKNAEKEREERKENLRKKEKSYLKEIKKIQAMCGVQPIGTDRLFRRYWIFNSHGGLFIEDNDPELPRLLHLEENDVEISCDDDSNSDSTSVSTEEDLSGPTSTSSLILHNTSSITSLSKKEIQQEKDLCRILKLYNMCPERLPDTCVLNNGESNLKREQTFAQLKSREIIQWSCLDRKDDLDQLLKSLNPRGYREKRLLESLLESYDMIVKGLQDNPLKLEKRQQRKETKQRRSQNQTVNKSLYQTMEEFIEASLRDQILDLEDRTWQAGLGMVKVSDITTWRKQVENGIYDVLPVSQNGPAEASGNGGSQENNAVTSCMALDQNFVTNLCETATTENMDVYQLSTEIKGDKNIKPKLLSNVQQSRPGTPVEGSFTSTPTSSRTPQTINPCVRVLAKAVLEVEQGIERKYLIPPLGEDDETKKRRQQEAADGAKRELHEIITTGKKKKEKDANEENECASQPNDKSEVSVKSKTKAQKSLVERWEESLMACTNLAQVFIYLTNLDNCISWDKSVLNARCRVCRRKGDAEHMLLCDGCDRGHHMYCLKPPIKQVPEGDWFCNQCRPVEPRRSVRRRLKSEDSNEESQDMTVLEINQNDSENDSDVGDYADGVGTEEDSEDSSDDDSSVHMESCACCDSGGELLCCETCPLAYHLECAYPPLRRVPRGSWACQVCTGADRDLPNGRRVNKTVIKAARQHAKGKEISKPPGKGTKVDFKHGQLRQQTTKLKTDKGNEVTSGLSKRQSSLPDSDTSKNNVPSKAVRLPAVHTKKCEKLLKELMEHEDSWPFLAPVSNSEAPDYTTVIKTPIDLQTIKSKLLSHRFSSTDDFVADIRQIFFNCSEYNKPRTREARAGIRLSAFFETRYGELGLDVSEHRGPRTRRSR